MSLLALLCALVAQPQDAMSQRLSPDYRATRAPVMLKDIGEKAGIKLEVEPRFTNEVLILKGKDVTLKELMDRIADVCEASWERTKEGYILKRAGYRQRELVQLDQKLRTDAIQKVFDAEAKTLAKWNTPEKRAGALVEGYASARRKADQGDYSMLSTSSIYHPSHQFYLKLLMAIGARPIASLPIGERVAYAFPANAAQVPLPPSYTALVEEFKETGEAVPRLFDEKRAKELPGYFASEWLKPYFKPLRIGKTIMVITNDHWGLVAFMGVYDPEGRALTTSVGVRVQYPFPAEPFSTSKPLHPVPYGQAAKELRTCYDPQGFLDDLVPMDKIMSEAGLARLLNPERFDPLAYHVSDAFLALAERYDRMLIGRLPDEIWRNMPLNAKEDSMRLEITLGAAAQTGLVVTDTDGWLVLKLSNPAHFERTRIRRASMGKFFRTSWAAKAMGFEDACRYEYENDAYTESSGISRPLRTVLIGLGVRPAKGAWGFMPPRLMAFLGTLSKDQWRRLKSDEPLPLDLLTSAQKEVFTKVIPVASPRGDTWQEDGTPAIMAHPSECIPFGPTKDTILKFKSDKQSIVKGIGEGVMAKLPTTIENLASYLASLAHEAQSTDFAQFLPKEIDYGTRTGYKWEIQLVPGIVYGPGDFYDVSVMEPKKKSFAELPSSFQIELKRLFDKHLAELKGGL